MDDDLPVTPSGDDWEEAPSRRRRAGERTPVVPGNGGRRRDGEDADATEVVPRVRRPAGERRRSTVAAPAERSRVRERRAAAAAGGASRVSARGGKRPNYWRRRVMVVLAALLAVVLGGVLWVGCSLSSSIHNIKRQGGMLPTGSRVDKKVEGAQTMLLIGSDKRPDGEGFGNSDSMMLVHFPADRKHVYIISMLRDMWVPVPGKEWAKLNSAYREGGPALTVQTFEQFLNIHIDHVATIDFEGFVHLTTSLGGVTVNNKTASSQGAYSWPQGKVTIQGDEALAYVRQRHELKNGDLDRSERQRAVVRAIIGKALSAGVVTNPATLTDFVDKASQTVTLDDTFSDSQVRGLITSMRVTSGDDVRTMMLPIAGYGETSRNTNPPRQSIDVIDREQVMNLAEALREDRLDAYWDTHDHDTMYTHNMPMEPMPEGPVPQEGLGLDALPSAAPRREG